MVLPGFQAAQRRQRGPSVQETAAEDSAICKRKTGEALSAWYAELCRREEGRRRDASCIEQERTNPSPTPKQAGEDGEAGLYCIPCDLIVPPASFDEHCASLSHQFRCAQNGPKDSQVMLDASNRGYRLLERLGWSEAEGCGLGPRRQGRVAPVPTELRDSRTGLGRERKRPRVTHFPRHSEREAHRAEDGLSRAQREQVARWSRGTLFRPELRRERAGDVARQQTHPLSRAEREAQVEEHARKARRAATMLRSDIPEGMEHLLAESSHKRRRKR